MKIQENDTSDKGEIKQVYPPLERQGNTPKTDRILFGFYAGLNLYLFD
jgi:hypothetical protein